MAGLSAPSINFCAAEVKSARPEMGRYSWLRLGSFRKISSAWSSYEGLLSDVESILTDLLNDRQHPRLRIVVSVRSNTQVDLLLTAILSVCVHQAKEGIFWCLRHALRGEDG